MELKKLLSKEIDKEITDIFIDTINKKANVVLGLATGSSPLGVYQSLINAYKEGKVSFKNVRSFNLDEYIGLDSTHNQSYRYFMDKNLFDQIDILKNNTKVPNGLGDVESNVVKYEKEIDETGGIDIQILGIGSNGHIAFNEPGTSFDSLTHIVELTKQTRLDNARFFTSLDEVPTHAITMGLASIMKAKKIVLIATGKNKAQAVKALIEGKPDVMVPASILQNHPDCTIFVDEEAASLLAK